jgi:hypothetical protein
MIELKFHLCLFLLFMAFFSSSSHARNSEEKLLLAYIYNLGKFISWPESKLEAKDPIELCFYGELGELSGKTKVLEKKTIQKHPILTSELSRGAELSHCNIIFISNSEEIYFRPILNKLANKPILTISNSELFIHANGMVALTYSNDKLRFDINKKTIEASGMKVSSQILRLARKVID